MSTSSLLAPGVALAVALGPAVVAPPAPSDPLPRVVLPSVHIEEIQLAGIGQDIYYAITPYVQYAVGGVSYLINFIPLIGGPIAAQININYFQGVQPIVEATVNYLAAVVLGPVHFPAATGAYGRQLYGIGYNWVDAELQFFGLPRWRRLLRPHRSAGWGRPDRVAAAFCGGGSSGRWRRRSPLTRPLCFRLVTTLPVRLSMCPPLTSRPLLPVPMAVRRMPGAGW